MQINWRIPHISGMDIFVPIEDGSRTFVVGPNGSGKSALIQHGVREFGADQVRRIAAHRQTWLTSSAINMTPQGRRQNNQSIFNREDRAYSLWQERNPEERISSVLFDLTAKENELAREIMRNAYAEDNEAIAKLVREERSVFDQLNELLSIGGFDVEIENSRGEAILARRKDTGETYGMERMSDGERSAVILAANVLTVDAGIVLLIDEPERHLHRSIIGPYLTGLIEQRSDCAFIISTHDVSLPAITPDATVLVVRSCQWTNDLASAWDVRLLQNDTGLPEDLNRTILGGRRRILFVEGTAQSLDIQLYNALFPEVLITPLGSCEDVVAAVTGLRTSIEYHDVEAFGLIDGDNRDSEDTDALRDKGIFALEQYSVESLYYCSEAMDAVADWQSESLGYDAAEMLLSAKRKGLTELSRGGVPERMSARRCLRQIQVQARSQLPDANAVMNASEHRIELEVKKWYEKELSTFRALLGKGDLDALVARYPVRHTPALDKLVNALHLQRKTYERTLISRVRSDSHLAFKLKNRIGRLADLLLQEG